MAEGDSIQLDPNLQTAPSSSAPVTFEDLRQFFSQNQQQSSQQASGLDAKSQASLDSLQPDFADRAKQWIQGMRDAGYNPVLHFGYRSPEEQQVLYQKHLAGGPQAVAPPMSYHTYGRAFDWVNQDAKGNLEWNNDKAYQFGQKLARNYNLTGIGAGDNDHIQDANFKSWKDLPRNEYGKVAPRQPAPGALSLNAGQTQVAQAQTDQNQSGVQWQDLSQYFTR
jgi:D-alanyl-D-alanine carboxypeptidase